MPADLTAMFLPMLRALAHVLMHPLVLFFACGTAGMIVHFYKRRLAGEVAEGLIMYAVFDYPKRSALALITFIAAEAAAFAAGGLDTSSLPTLIGLGFTTGYTLDSAVNKSATA